MAGMTLRLDLRPVKWLKHKKEPGRHRRTAWKAGRKQGGGQLPSKRRSKSCAYVPQKVREASDGPQPLHRQVCGKSISQALVRRDQFGL